MPAPLNNRNAMTHGITAGRLPRGAAYIKRATDRLRCVLEQETLDVRGQVGVWELLQLNSIVRWERLALLAQRWLRSEELTIEQKLSLAREIARASTERDKCVEKLGIRRDSQDPYASLYSQSGPGPLDVKANGEVATDATPEPQESE
jgi:hypothetical protein